MVLRQFCYQSTARHVLGPDELGAIMLRSRRSNRLLGVTGLLLFDGRRFLQALEGEPAAVESTWRRIRADERHHRLEVIADDPLDGDLREFGGWSMALLRLDGTGYTRLVPPLVAGVRRPLLRNQFELFAGLEPA